MLNKLAGLLWGRSEVVDYPFIEHDVARYHVLTQDAQPAMLDEQTWREMLLSAYSERLASGASIFGRQMLHARLRRQQASPQSLQRLRRFSAEPGLRERLQEHCQPLRQADAEASTALFGPELPATPLWARWLGVLPYAFLGSVALAFFWVPAWIAVVAGWLLLMALQAVHHERVQEWNRVLYSLRLMLQVHAEVGAAAPQLVPSGADSADSAGLAAFIPAGAQIKRLRHRLVRSVLERLPLASEYANWLMLRNVRHYYATRATVMRQRALLRESFALVADLDADLALARHLAQTPRHCWTQQAAPGALALEALYHPLLDEAAPLSLHLDEGCGAFISGQNGVGKSTLLRAIGLNLIAGRAFGFCYASAAALPQVALYSSMQGEDSLGGGESLYQAELRRAQELLALGGQGQPVFFIIDEIFRGTNHLESISAAAAVLHELTARGTVIVSSHNLVLGPLLQAQLRPLCVQRDGENGLRLRAGLLNETNGLRLLSERNFGADIEARAARVFDWLSDYMAHPGDCSGVLAAAEPELPALV
ncbi:DNA mismatch repair protein MutS [Massilia sp. BJB1822]|uniref:MutS-related protein n=1 Tax=Massilia sp. BJB1822 TaxID=2744470 RepID=UPI001594CF22|nr:DNA mismatch repair protein MutS [Massilia sp. BJB1822]NVD99718.1 DNA mismatch repair protein MutS [Massilia sp. BJB1822]